MFGLLRPLDPSKPERREFQSTYCNLCGTLSHEYGVTTRFLVLYDFASLAWLFSEDDTERPFVRLNCVKGGVRFRRHEPESADEFLAAISVFTCGVKIRDDIADDDSVRARFSGAFYRKTFAKAELKLKALGFDVKAMQAILQEQQSLEERWERRLEVASCPTGKAYGMVARHLSQLSGTMNPAECEQIGEQIGRLVFLADAFRDIKKDAGRAYNPLTQPSQDTLAEISSVERQELVEYVASCLERVDLIVAEQEGSVFSARWSPLRRQLLALFGLKTSSVILNSQCCIPCGDCFVVVDSDECGQGCLGCCILFCCAAYFCTK